LSFGAYLRQSRTLRQVSLDEVATTTKLPARIVAALESDDFAALQDRAHALKVARSYATAIGLDPEETALRLEEDLQGRASPGTPHARPFKRLWDRRPREPLVWIVVAVTLAACVALLFRGH
jgi:cytoskeletal protein RodZ